MDQRATRGGKVEHKVRQIARRVMKETAAGGGASDVADESPEEWS
jgi:hypothetical protein